MWLLIIIEHSETRLSIFAIPLLYELSRESFSTEKLLPSLLAQLMRGRDWGLRMIRELCFAQLLPWLHAANVLPPPHLFLSAFNSADFVKNRKVEKFDLS